MWGLTQRQLTCVAPRQLPHVICLTRLVPRLLTWVVPRREIRVTCLARRFPQQLTRWFTRQLLLLGAALAGSVAMWGRGWRAWAPVWPALSMALPALLWGARCWLLIGVLMLPCVLETVSCVWRNSLGTDRGPPVPMLLLGRRVLSSILNLLVIFLDLR